MQQYTTRLSLFYFDKLSNYSLYTLDNQHANTAFKKYT